MVDPVLNDTERSRIMSLLELTLCAKFSIGSPNAETTLHRFQNNRQNRLKFVYTHFKSCDQSLDKTPVDFSNIFHAIQSCAMNAKSSIIPKLPMGMIT